MTNKKPNFIIEFDGKKYSKMEQEDLIYRFISCLMKIESRQLSQNAKAKKEQKRIENEFMNFGSKVIKGIKNQSSVD